MVDNAAIRAIESLLEDGQPDPRRRDDEKARNAGDAGAALPGYRTPVGSNLGAESVAGAVSGSGESARKPAGSVPRRLRLQDYLSSKQRQRVERGATPLEQKVEEPTARVPLTEPDPPSAAAFNTLRDRKQGT